ncbi:MAG: hypothetical protein WHT08_12620 [Bryobacteraceae bacterium]
MRAATATIASRSRISLARATAVSCRQHHPELPVFCLLADEPHESIRPGGEPFEILELGSLRIPAEHRLRFRYGEMELSYALTPFLIEHLLRAGFETVIFLKQETMVLDRFDGLLEQLNSASILLTPHFLEPPSGADAFRREWNVLRAGIFNGGVLGFSGCEEAFRVLAWWKQRTLQWCLLDVEQGLHYEQRWLDFLPSLAPGLRIVRDPGVNVGHWNLPERRIRVQGGRVTACGQPCRIFRFSGYDPARPDRISRYSRTMVAETGDAARVFAAYHQLLLECGWQETHRLPYAWDRFDNGVPIPAEARRLYRALGTEAERFGDPFQTGPADSFFHWWTRRRPRPEKEAILG